MCELFERPLQNKKIIARCGLASFEIIGPYFFDDEGRNILSVDSRHYANMLTTFLEPVLDRRGIKLVATLFQWDEPTAHTARASMNTLREMFGNRLISHRVDIQWPPRSRDLNACDYFLWRYLKGKVYQNRPSNTADLKRNIRTEVVAVSPDVLQRALQGFPSQLQQQFVDNVGHR